jgi:hypothetical protein
MDYPSDSEDQRRRASVAPTDISSEEVATSGGSEMSDSHDDYVNASYVQPICTRRRYIATQGPLEATFADFWTLVLFLFSLPVFDIDCLRFSVVQTGMATKRPCDRDAHAGGGGRDGKVRLLLDGGSEVVWQGRA